MATFSRKLLSSTPAGGRVIPIAATSSPGTLIHTAVTGAAAYEEVYLWASNVTANSATLTIEWGGVLNPGDWIVRTVPIAPNSPPFPILVGQTMNGGLDIRAFSDTANAINVSGYTNLIQ